jgi:hypothetical protein
VHNFSQEEEDWLDALEAGELDDFGRLKQEKDTSMMTARQVSLQQLLQTDRLRNIDKIFKILEISTIHSNSIKEHPKISRNAKFGSEMF